MSMPTGHGGRLRKVLPWILLGIAVTGVGSAVIAFRAYDQATRIDRRYPEVVVRDYIDAVFVKRDDARASLYTCDADAGLKPIHDLRDLLLGEERQGVSTRIVLGRSHFEAPHLEIQIQVVQEGQGATTRDLQHWEFIMVDEDGWRVCGAQRLPDPSPSMSASLIPPTAQ